MKRIVKTKLSDLHQTHGQAESYEPSTLEQLIGETGINKYSTLDRNEYLGSLNGMNKTDLYRHSVSLGYVPLDNRDRLIKKLISEFDLYTNSYKKPKSIYKEPKKISSEVAVILAGGR